MAKIEVRLNPDVQPSGSDLAVVNAARRSFNTRSDWLSESECPTDPHHGGKIPPYKRLKESDKRLLEYLARGMTSGDYEQFLIDASETGKDWIHREVLYAEDPKELFKELLWEWRNTPTHDTPFNHCFISFEVKAPIFVARQLVKHEYLIMSEFSRRYITDDIEFYLPNVFRGAAENKKQGSSGIVKDSNGDPKTEFLTFGDTGYTDLGLQELSTSLYQQMVKEGVAPEQARMVLPQSTMTEWTWSGTLGAFAKMCQLRLHPDAQFETRVVAGQVYEYLLAHYPVSAKALVEGPDV